MQLAMEKSAWLAGWLKTGWGRSVLLKLLAWGAVLQRALAASATLTNKAVPPPLLSPCSGDPSKPWFGRVVAFLSYLKRGRSTLSQAPFVRYYDAALEECPRAAPLKMARLKWGCTSLPDAIGSGDVASDWLGLVLLRDISRAVLIQHDPTTLLKPHTFFLQPLCVLSGGHRCSAVMPCAMSRFSYAAGCVDEVNVCEQSLGMIVAAGTCQAVCRPSCQRPCLTACAEPISAIAGHRMYRL